jgi:5-methylcytosine-specific restriction endonuclease McrA
VTGLGYTENMLPQKGVSNGRRRHIEEARLRLRHHTYRKNGAVFWETGKPVALDTFADAFCTPSQKQITVVRPPRRRDLLVRLSEAQNHRCCYCGVHTSYVKCQDHTATIEHLVPQAQGGTDAYDNCVMACLDCNNKRKTMDAMLFFEGKLWLPEMDLTRELMSKMRAFVRVGDVRILRAMKCCESA